MPCYLYKHPETEEIKEIYQGMNEEHVYGEEGVEWVRVFTVPNAMIDSDIDPYSKNQFLEKTKTGTIGDLWDRSAEWSQKRADDRDGVDPIKKKAIEEHKKVRGGKGIRE